MNELENQNIHQRNNFILNEIPTPSTEQILKTLDSKLLDEEYLLLAPTNKWPTLCAEEFPQSVIMQSDTHPCHQVAIHQHKDWQNNEPSKKIEGFSDYNHRPLTKSLIRTRAYFATESNNQKGSFLAEIIGLAIELNQYLFSCKKFLNLLAANNVSRFYQLWISEILINRGWLFLQSLFQLALLSYDLKQIGLKSTSVKVNAKAIYQTIDRRLAPLYHCNGLALAEYWHPIFLYILHHPKFSSETKAVPANYKTNRNAIDDDTFIIFQSDLKVNGTTNWVSRFGRCLGLLD